MAVKIATCIGCKRLFRYPGFGAKYCPSCLEADRENQKKVKEYIKANGAANMYQISEATGVPTNIIRQYLRDGMLEIPDGSPVYIQCESCGRDIRSGRWCPACAARMSGELKGLYVGVGEVPKKQSSGKMRFLDKKD